jgi:hypothetical protein
MESIAPTATLARRTTIWSTCESVNRKSASQEEDVLIFFSSLETQSTLESMTTFSGWEIHGDIIWITHLVFLKGFPFLGVPSSCFLIIGLSSNSRRCSHTHKKNRQLQRNKLQRAGLFFLFLVILRCQIHGYFNCLLSSSFSFTFIYIMKKPKRQQLTDRIYKQMHKRKNEKTDIR